MNTSPSQELQREKYLEFRTYLQRFPWEWLATLTFQEEVDFFSVQRQFRRWYRLITDEEKLRIAVYLLSSYKRGRIHLHALLFGRNQKGKTLNSCSKKKWESVWHGHARIKNVKDIFKVCDYVALHFMGFKSDHTEIDSYNKSLLKQEMALLHDGLDGFDGLSHH